MLEVKVGDRVRSREDGLTGTVMRREHDFEEPRYVIDWDDGEQSEIWVCPVGDSPTGAKVRSSVA
jgi:hypothetical protein